MATAAPKKTSTAVAAAISDSLLILTFANQRVLTVDAKALSPAIRHAAMMHGLKQKLIDGAAIARDPETGRTATIDDKYDAVADIYSRITHATEPAWNKVRGGEGTGGNVKGGVFVTALMRMTTKSRDDIESYLAKLSKEEVAALRKNPRVADLMRLIQAERTDTSKVDTDALLDGLMEGANGGDDGYDESESDDGTGDPSASQG
jgi:hypothetical protein